MSQLPEDGALFRPKGIYVCAIYETGAGRGNQSVVTGQSTNYVVSIEITAPSDLLQKYWSNKGIVALCQRIT